MLAEGIDEAEVEDKVYCRLSKTLVEEKCHRERPVLRESELGGRVCTD